MKDARNFRMLGLVAAGLLVAPAALAQAEVVGRVLMAAGDTAVVRDGQVVRLTYGSGIRNKDLLQTGPRSNLQVRFADQSIVSLRERTQFRIEDFRFSGKPGGEESAFFQLVKGAFRTVTGLIGRSDHARYAVRAPSATIGIRGTMYAAAYCEKGECGGQKDGLYGMVIGQSHGTNKLSLKNQAIDTVIQQGQVFYVASETSAVEFLLEPPEPLIDSLAGAGQADRATATALGTAATGGSIEQLSLGGSASIGADSRPNAMPTSSEQVMQFTALSPTIQVTQFVSSDGVASVLPPIQSQDFVAIGGSGVVRGQMLWTTTADMDLHMITPDGVQVYYGNSLVNFPLASPTATATLDVDNTSGVNHPSAITVINGQTYAVENIYVTGTVVPDGTYTFFTRNFSGVTTAPTLVVTGDSGVTSRIHSVPALTSGTSSGNYLVTRNPNGTVTYSP
jgi:hypothetical protein